MSGYDETNPETYRPTEPSRAADGSYPGVGSQSAASQGTPGAAASGSEPPSEPLSESPSRAGDEDLSQAYGADASQSEPVLPGTAQAADAENAEYTRPLPADQPTSQMPADQPTSLYAQSAQGSSPSYEEQQGQYQPAQGQYQSQQQPYQQSYQQGQPDQYPAISQGQPATSYSQSSAAQQPYQAHLGSPYTSVPTTSGGYDFPRTEDHGGGGPVGGSQAGPSSYAPVGAAGESFYAASNASGGGSGKKRRRGPGWVALVASVVVASLLGAGGAVGAVKYLDARDGTLSSRSSAAPTAIATGDTTKTVNSSGQAPDWEAVSAAVSNAVVSIAIATDRGTALGSGVIYDKDGHIITNNHVVAGAAQIQVTLADGRVYDADTTGTDPATDLAVIQLKDAPDNLTVAQLGDSDKLTTGQDVMAIGNPLGLSSTVTTGIISALDRPVVNSQGEDGSGGRSSSSAVYTNAIQIDAAINPGNSGGPLFDEKGQVIGITSSIATMSRSSSEGGSGSIGIGFAIPVKLADKVAKQLIKSGTATHAYLGVTLDTAGATADGEKRGGAKITSVESGSPADKAGLKTNDVVIAIDGKTTAQGSALTGYVRQYSANDKVKLTVIRDSKKQDIDVTLAERKDS